MRYADECDRVQKATYQRFPGRQCRSKHGTADLRVANTRDQVIETPFPDDGAGQSGLIAAGDTGVLRPRRLVIVECRAGYSAALYVSQLPSANAHALIVQADFDLQRKRRCQSWDCEKPPRHHPYFGDCSG